MIGLLDFLKTAGIKVDTTDLKIHLACWNGREHPIDEYFSGRFEEWQSWQTKRNFQCKQVISLIDRGQGEWLFAGVYQILGYEPHPSNEKHILYSTKALPKQDKLIGRIAVYHKRRGRNSYIWFKEGVNLQITEIRRDKLTIEDFPGYNSVVLSHSSLRIITKQKIASWHGALANIKGIYLITDTTTGKHYIGKASGRDGIWQRWGAYADNGHGGNKELRSLLKNKGKLHVTHFQYSILEIADTHASDGDILAREAHWMKALKSREFGLN